MNKRYILQVGDIITFTFKGFKMKFFVGPYFEYRLPRLKDYFNITEKTPIDLLGLGLCMAGEDGNVNNVSKMQAAYPILGELDHDYYFMTSVCKESEFWTSIARYIHDGSITDFTIYTLNEHTVHYNTNVEYKVVSTKNPFKDSVGNILFKATYWCPRIWHTWHLRNIEDFYAILKLRICQHQTILVC